MPIETSGRQTRESIEQVAQRIEMIAAQIRASAAFMSLEPQLSVFQAPRQTSLENGLERLQSWADGLRDAIHAAKLESARGVSVANGKTKKQREK